jgi:LmeA-like phospholipid-binding
MNRRAVRRVRLSSVLLGASILLGSALVLWGADTVARWSAESYLARQVQALTGVLDRPTVEVHGAFFLPQVFTGRYERVEVTLDDLRSGPLRLQQVTVDLHGVHVPFGDLLGQNTVPVYIEGSRERATLTVDDLNHYLDVTGRPISVRTAADGEVVVTGTASVFGQQVSASSRAVLGADEGNLSVRPTGLETATVLDGPGQLLLRQRFTFVIPMDSLPFGQRLTAIEVGEMGLELEARGTDLVVTP